MEALFINPPFLKDGREGVRAGSRWPYTVQKLKKGDTIPFPFFMAYSAAILRQQGVRVSIIDAIAERMDLQKFFAELKQKSPELIVMETSTPSFKVDAEILGEVRTEFPQAKIAFAGAHVTVFPEETLKGLQGLDFVLLGEYEYTVRELAEKISKGQKTSVVKGIAYRAGKKTINNGRRALVENLDELPFPARDLLAMYDYNDCFPRLVPNVQLLASRGCLYRCPFCVWPKVMYAGHSYRMRSAKNVVDEIEQVLTDYKFKELYFDDDSFNINEAHVNAFCNEMTARGIKIPWSCMGHTVIKRETLENMKRAGCEGIKFGVETGNEAILCSLGKGTTKQTIRQAFRNCRDLGIRTHATFTLGLPGETKQTIEDTKRFVLELAPDSVQFSITVPFPGTEYYEIAKKDRWFVTEDWSKFDGSCGSVIRTKELSPEMLEEALREMQEIWAAFSISRNPLGAVSRFARDRGFKELVCRTPSYLGKFIGKRKKMKKYL